MHFAQIRPYSYCFLVFVLGSVRAFADGIVVDKIYAPYVQPLETELEFRAILQNDDALGDLRKYSLGVGRSVSDNVWAELYLIGTEVPGHAISLDAYEAEIKWQLSEQGEFAFDWGLLFELEREVQRNSWELESSLIVSREWRRWTGTTNLKLIYEWGSGLKNEFETAANTQFKYRLSEKFEPAIELYIGQNNRSIGPAITGLWRTGASNKLRWLAGAYAGLGSQSPDFSAMVTFEFEF